MPDDGVEQFSDALLLMESNSQFSLAYQHAKKIYETYKSMVATYHSMDPTKKEEAWRDCILPQQHLVRDAILRAGGRIPEAKSRERLSDKVNSLLGIQL